MARILSIFLVIFYATTSSIAADLGVRGPVSEIAERDFLQMIEERLKSQEESGELYQNQLKLQSEFLDKSKRPIGNKMPRAKSSNVRYMDPTITVKEDIKAPNGQIIVKAGTKANPLEKGALTQKMIFINSDDKEQVAYLDDAIMLEAQPIIILVNGSPFELMDKLGKQIYFDQAGFLAKRFGIKAVPTIVTQDGLRLKIQEIDLDEVADE